MVEESVSNNFSFLFIHPHSSPCSCQKTSAAAPTCQLHVRNGNTYNFETFSAAMLAQLQSVQALFPSFIFYSSFISLSFSHGCHIQSCTSLQGLFRPIQKQRPGPRRTKGKHASQKNRKGKERKKNRSIPLSLW